MSATLLLLSVGAAVALIALGCGAAGEAETMGDGAGDGAEDGDLGVERAPIQTPLFFHVSAPFSIQGSKGMPNIPPLQLALPGAPYTKLIPVVELREYSVGDKDFAYQFGYTQAGGLGHFNYVTSEAPDVSYGVANVVGGRVTVLGFPAAVGAVWSGIKKAKNNDPATLWPTTTFGTGTYRYFRSLWSMVTGGDDDFEFESSVNGSMFRLHGSGGNASSFAEVASTEIAAPGDTVKTMQWNVGTKPDGTGKTVVTMSWKPGAQHVVLASADSYVTCGKDQYAFKVACVDSAVSSTCTITTSGGKSGCSRVGGWMVLLQNGP